MDTLERTKILKLIQQEVIPAIGCTEPISVALCTAKATEILGTIPEKITVYLSANILKNAMGVGIPGTGMIGLPKKREKNDRSKIDQHFSKRKYSRKTLYRSLLSDISESFYRNNCGGTYSFYLHIQK